MVSALSHTAVLQLGTKLRDCCVAWAAPAAVTSWERARSWTTGAAHAPGSAGPGLQHQWWSPQDVAAGWWEQHCESRTKAAAEQNRYHRDAVSPARRRKSSQLLRAVSKDLQTDLQPLQGKTTFLQSFPCISNLAEYISRRSVS